MKHALVVATAIVASGLVTAPTAAGEIRVPVAFYPAMTASPEVNAEGDGIAIQKQSGDRLSFQFMRQDTVRGSLTLSVPNPPPGYSPFKIILDVPYFWDGPASKNFGVAVVTSDVSDASAAAFLRGIGGGPTSTADIILIRQRASRLWAERLNQLSTGVRWVANSDDVRIAYWLLRTTSDLVVSHVIEIDETTRSAMSWLSGRLADDDEKRRLFGSRTISVEQANELLRILNSRDAILYNYIVQKLEEGLTENPASVCPKIEALDVYFSALDQRERISYDGSFASSLKIKSDVIQCRARAIREAKATGQSIPSETIDELKKAIESGSAAVVDAQSLSQFPRVRSEVKSRIRDVGEFIR